MALVVSFKLLLQARIFLKIEDAVLGAFPLYFVEISLAKCAFTEGCCEQLDKFPDISIVFNYLSST